MSSDSGSEASDQSQECDSLVKDQKQPSTAVIHHPVTEPLSCLPVTAISSVLQPN